MQNMDQFHEQIKRFQMSVNEHAIQMRRKIADAVLNKEELKKEIDDPRVWLRLLFLRWRLQTKRLTKDDPYTQDDEQTN